MAVILRAGFPSGYCVGCLAARLGLPIEEARDAAQVLVGRASYCVVHCQCYTCGRVAPDVLLFVGDTPSPAEPPPAA
jgi:hypothetical protein